MDEAKQEAEKKAGFQLRRKRKIKRQVAAERRRPEPERAALKIDALTIKTLDRAPEIFHAATMDDIRALVALLPPAAVQGIGHVRLLLGKEYMAEHDGDGSMRPDPLTGRLGCELFPGVFCGPVLGTYFPTEGRIDLYAYVIDGSRLLVPRAMVELFLQLQALKTFVHEVAHFHDHVARVGRGRWLADRWENNEWYAEKMEHHWTDEFVVPYLERRYAKECRQFRAWVKQRGGVELPIGFFAGDSRRTERNGLTRLVFSTAGAFEQWLEELPRCATLADARLALAWELHYADQYEECLVVLNVILAAEPTHVKARVCRADTLEHLERPEEALADADVVLAVAPGEGLAWSALECVRGARGLDGLARGVCAMGGCAAVGAAPSAGMPALPCDCPLCARKFLCRRNEFDGLCGAVPVQGSGGGQAADGSGASVGFPARGTTIADIVHRAVGAWSSARGESARVCSRHIGCAQKVSVCGLQLRRLPSGKRSAWGGQPASTRRLTGR